MVWVLLLGSLASCAHPAAAQASDVPWMTPHAGNPITPGYFADASIVLAGGESYIFATEDPWGGETLGCWHSADMVRWTLCTLNWPTKQAASTPESNRNLVWAPSVVRARNGKYYMYVSVGSEVWVGVADAPLGPWKNALGDKPLIPATFNRAYNMIDAEVFLDTDGTAYLYWGSGLHWVNGHCFAVRLKPDMISFDGEPRDVTPPHYFEGPFMYKHAGKYYLMYSEGKTTNSSYNVRYSVGDTPFGPFREGVNSPILVSDEARQILGPGHHAVFDRDGKTYILYHRHSLPFDAAEVKRQLCVDELRFDAQGEMEKVYPTNQGPPLLHRVSRIPGAIPVRVTASSSLDAVHAPDAATDDNYATRWAPARGDVAPWLQVDLLRAHQNLKSELRFEYPERAYSYRLEASLDGRTWVPVRTGEPRLGSPITIRNLPPSRYLRLTFASTDKEPISLLEWTVF